MRQAALRESREGRWLERELSRVDIDARAPKGFTERVMNAVYREALSSRAAAREPGAAERASAAARHRSTLRLYRRIAVSLMLTAAVLAVSLLVPTTAYPTLIGPREGAALGGRPSEAVRTALAGAGSAVQDALGERSIEGGVQ